MNAHRHHCQLKPRRGVPFIAQGKAPRRRIPVTVAINSIRAVSATERLLTAAFGRTYSAQLIVDADTGLRAHSSRLPCATNGTPRWGFGLSRPRAVTITASSHLSKGETHLSTHTFAKVCQTGAFHLWKGETRQKTLTTPSFPRRRESLRTPGLREIPACAGMTN